VANTLAYYNTATITAIKSFIVQAPDGSAFPGFKLMCFVYIIYFKKIEYTALAFNQETCSHIALS